MTAKGLTLIRMVGDGACLFRAVSQAVYGDAEVHNLVRSQCMDYMLRERDHFAPYVVESFDEYVRRKRDVACFGDHLEIQAMSEMYCRPVHVYSVERSAEGVDEPLNIFQPPAVGLDPILLSFHSQNHYNYLQPDDRPSAGVGLGLPGYDPHAQREAMLPSAQHASERDHLEEQLVRDTLERSERSDLEAEMEQVAMQVRSGPSACYWLRSQHLISRARRSRSISWMSIVAWGSCRMSPQLCAGLWTWESARGGLWRRTRCLATILRPAWVTFSCLASRPGAPPDTQPGPKGLDGCQASSSR